MPSSNKTANYFLNKWISSDKPKMDDFNGDNSIIDGALSDIAERLTAAEEAAGSSGELTEHIADSDIHVTADEKTAWTEAIAGAGDTMQIFTYVGNDYMERQITLPCAPKFGLFYAVGKGPSESRWNSGTEGTRIYSGFFGTSGCSSNISLSGSTLMVVNNAGTTLTGQAYRYNEIGITYVCILWEA